MFNTFIIAPIDKYFLYNEFKIKQKNLPQTFASVHTYAMKTAFSLPEPLLKRAGEIAAKLQISQAELHQRALENFIKEFEQDQLLQDLNDACERRAERLGKALENMQHTASLETEKSPQKELTPACKKIESKPPLKR